jgi:hypothetical protein
MKSVNANKINRKSGEAEGPAVSLSKADDDLQPTQRGGTFTWNFP